MLLLLHLLTASVCAAECAFALARPNAQIARLMIFGPLGVIHGLVPALMLDADWESPAQLAAAKMALLGLCAFSVAWRLFDLRFPQPWPLLSPQLTAFVRHPQSQRALRWLFTLSALAAVGSWLGSMIASAGSIQAAWQAGRFEFRGAGNVLLTAIFTHIYTNLVLVPGFLGFFLSRRWRWLGVVFALTMAVLLFVGSKGGRGTSLGLLVGLGVGYALSQPLRGMRLFALIASGVFVIMLSSSLYEVRKVMQNADYNEQLTIILDPEIYKDTLRRDPLNYHDFLISAVEVFPSRHPFLDGATYIRLLIFPIPQAYAFGLKPDDTNLVFANALSYRRTQMTIPPTMMGDGYINFWGWPGVALVMALNGVFFAFMASRMRQDIWWFLCFGATFGRVAVMSLRGQPYEIVTGLISALALFLVLGRLSRLPSARRLRASSLPAPA